jgi:TPR repeat protein
MKTTKYEYNILLNLAKNNDLFAIKKLVKYFFYEEKSDSEIIPLDNETLLHYLNILIENKDSDAMLELGALYYSGDNEIVEQNFEKAIELYNNAANNKSLDFFIECNSNALNNLGYCYLYGRDIKQDYEKAFYYFSKASFFDNPNAMYKIGDMYKYGNFVEKDNNSTLYWYKKALSFSEEDDYVFASVSFRIAQEYFYGNNSENTLFESFKYPEFKIEVQ